MDAVIGFFGGLVRAVVMIVAAAGFLTFIIVAWMSGALPEILGWVGLLIQGFFAAVTGFFGFLRELIVTAREAAAGA